jgi:hypothetical protein
VLAPRYNPSLYVEQITDYARELAQRDPALAGLAGKVQTPATLIAHLRSQRGDEGAQTIDPNCFERAAVYLSVAELLDQRSSS